MVVSILSAKGGTGKSTITINMGSILSKDNTVLVIDADPQGSIALWADRAEQDSPSVLVESSPIIHTKITHIYDQFDIILIDTPPSFREQTQSVIHVSDRIIVPICPGMFDVWSTQRILQEIGDKPVRLLLSRVDRRTRIGKEFRFFVRTLQTQLFKTEIPQRVLIAESFLAGKTIDQYQPHSTETEIFAQLAEELIQWYNE